MLQNLLSFRRFILLLLIAILATFLNVPACHTAMRTVSGKVTKVSDGDTIHVTTPERTKLKVRLYGIDAPETHRVSAHSGQNPMVPNPLEGSGEQNQRAAGKARNP